LVTGRSRRSIHGLKQNLYEKWKSYVTKRIEKRKRQDGAELRAAVLA
jgi:hypothetical protein